ncbi:MAG: periplasmic heavy metal sensor [Acidobacteria bacterium]|nr:periplasmic heavy metal sensor [Acidobacteriota bacterium]MBV9479053.1 periplasmic heavy metal sensor [Acidobacteriota bacterium]
MKKTRTLIVIAALLLSAFAAHAQQMPQGKWWRRAEIIQELALTAEQQQQLDDIFRTTADELIDAKAAVEKLQVALRGEIDRPQLRRDEIRRIAARLTEARGKLFDRELMMLVDMRGVLSETQWNRMRAVLDRDSPMRNQLRKNNPQRPRLRQ